MHCYCIIYIVRCDHTIRKTNFVFRIKNYQRSNSNIGEMKAISRVKQSHWRNGTEIRSSTDTIRTTVGQDFDTKSIRSVNLNGAIHS